MRPSIVVRDKFGHDKLEIVWLWLPKAIIEMEEKPEFPYKTRFLKPSYTAWWCWAVKRTGTYIGVVYEPVSTLNTEGYELAE